MQLFCLSAHAAATYTRRVPVSWEKWFFTPGPKVTLHFSFTLPSYTFSFSTFRLCFSHFFPFFFFKDIFNVSEAVGFLANWLKLATQRFSQKHRAPAPRRESNHSHDKPRERFQLLRCNEFKKTVCCFVVWG